MLVEFRFSNFKSFQTEQVLSMVASGKETLPSNIMTVPGFKHKLLRAIAIYGANAAGKSNVLEAIDFMDTLVRKSDTYKPEAKIPLKLFQLDKDSQQSPAKFEVTFIHEKTRYQYGFIVDRHHIHEEWLLAYPTERAQVWFERKLKPNNEGYDWYFGPQLKGAKKNLVTLTAPPNKLSNKLFLSVAATFEHEQLYQVYQWFATRLFIINAESSNILEMVSIQKAMNDSAFQNVFKQRLQFADFGVVDFQAEEKTMAEADLPDDLPSELRLLFLDGKRLDFQLKHQTNHETPVAFDLKDESLGTRRFLALTAPWYDAFRQEATLFVDELDASLHPILVKELIQEFQNSQSPASQAQLIFNTHNVTFLDSTLFQRDQIWFVEKDTGGASHLYPLLDFSPRTGEALAKGYLQGRYGAIPFLRPELLEEVTPHG